MKMLLQPRILDEAGLEKMGKVREFNFPFNGMAKAVF